ncbi:capsule assembly Wzi family protein [Ulvibacter antarcticus]|uniref:Capsule assembly protein Wzi n=1 Tax=Ulvibacter antarcticus TaxID=442714 RepID=A0A3L9YF06_9FLAO|nr:capsule assembly Wzi family protein [Ulvibacter antarcticus]RMA58964.1 capsule assembly protein Wzi [Ulvibacter antarcticus]
MKRTLILLCLISPLGVFAQKVSVTGSLSATGIFSSEENIPFWFYTNTNTSKGAFTNFSGVGEVKGVYPISNATLEAGTALFYRDGVNDEFQRRDLYLKFENNWLKVTAGSKKQDENLNGLSSTNQNFLLSSNARPLPGIIIEANNPLKVFKSFGIDWGIAHYLLNDDRFVDNAKVHYKRFGIHWKINENNRIYGRIQHYALWGGNSELGEQAESFGDFLDIFVAKQTGDRVNALGNHLGSYLLEYSTKSNIGEFKIYHDHPFEDGSGTRLANFPDGVWGVFFEPADDSWITSVLYEYIDTTDQSYYRGGSGYDSYFNHRFYRSGWTYESNTIGLPFIVPPGNNRIRAHQFGITSKIKKVELLFKATFLNNFGHYAFPIDPSQKAFYSFGKASYSIEKYGKFSVFFGYDYKDTFKDIVAGGFSYQYFF